MLSLQFWLVAHAGVMHCPLQQIFPLAQPQSWLQLEHVSAPSQMLLPQTGLQSLSLSDVHPVGQHWSLLLQVVIVCLRQLAEQVLADWQLSTVQLIPSSQLAFVVQLGVVHCPEQHSLPVPQLMSELHSRQLSVS